MRQARSFIDNLGWDGQAKQALYKQLEQAEAKARPVIANLRSTAEKARAGKIELDAKKSDALAAIAAAERDAFTVNEDLTVIDKLPPIGGTPGITIRATQRAAHQATIQARAQALVTVDNRIATEMHAAAAELDQFHLGGPGGGTDFSGDPKDPKISGPSGPLRPEENKPDYGNADLGFGFADGQGPTFWGDPQTADDDGNPVKRPRDPKLEQMLDPGDTKHRALPTGTAIGPNGERYVFASKPEIGWDAERDAQGRSRYVTESTAYDWSDPSHPRKIDPLVDSNGHPIFQASGAYDKATNRMVIVGNASDLNADGTRKMWLSDPIKAGDPPDSWTRSLHDQGAIPGLAGARENQVVALQGGGFMLTGSDDMMRPGHGPAAGAIVAATPEGLLKVPPQAATNLFPDSGQWPGIKGGHAAPYAPTVVGTTWDPVKQVETVQLRVSTWEVDPNWKPNSPTDIPPYNPKTYLTSVPVSQPNP
ncbi:MULTISPECIES: hypothetical protein [unclassified Mycobacteroides]|uniref:hypothetical protein n=1 Tax=unclassified Mycobacteroides TaxID=2618759 RepID=UPI001EF06BC1